MLHVFRFGLAVRRILGLNLHQVIGLGCIFAAALFITITFVVYRHYGPWAAALTACTLALAVYNRLANWAGYGTPELMLQKRMLLPQKEHDEGRAIRVVFMTDTHNFGAAHSSLDDEKFLQDIASKVPSGDIFLHAGDFTVDGSVAEVRSFDKFLSFLPHKHKVVIAGNHCISLDPHTYVDNLRHSPAAAQEINQRDFDWYEREILGPVSKMHGAHRGAPHEQRRNLIHQKLLPHATHYLEFNTVSVPVVKQQQQRVVTICGCPCTDAIAGAHAAGFARTYDEQMSLYNAALPSRKTDRVDILISHGPPRTKNTSLDRTFFGMQVGSLALSKTLVRLWREGRPPLFSVFGHIHEGRGAVTGTKAADLGVSEENAPSGGLPTYLINGCSVNLRYSLRPGPLGMAVVFDIPVSSLKSE